MSILKTTLPNNVRILVEQNDHVHSAAIGLWCRTGSRHELEHEAGITHFIEHMLFKGTPSRNALQIAEEIEGRGGILNAFTDKEQTCYYCRVLAEDVDNGVDVLSDMMLHSLLDQEEIDRERGVILEEIKRSEDEPSDFVHELHLSGRWGDHPLGKPIIGTRDSVSGFNRPDFCNYIKRRYRGENVVLGIAGKVDPDRVIQKASELLGTIASGVEAVDVTRPGGSGGKREIGKDVEQVHFCIGTEGASIYDDDYYTLAVLDGILGSGMSSRLFQEVRERRGLAYAIGSYSLSYTAGGAFTVYGGTGRQTWEQVQEVVAAEFRKISTELVPDPELERTKRLISGNMVLAMEGMNARMTRMVKNEINFGRDIPMEETLAKVRAVTAESVRTLAERILDPEQVSTTAIGPF
ncbi:MAG: insulinase family protein [Armatimonadetes bacterium]|nr:insulinase family protein [Armatimonadota bacterium]